MIVINLGCDLIKYLSESIYILLENNYKYWRDNYNLIIECEVVANSYQFAIDNYMNIKYKIIKLQINSFEIRINYKNKNNVKLIKT